ncbi:methyltransferase-like protein 7A [Iris pallida]|uniref:Methyltransferase-like protein 7A n=1 Tax=Iris pallida TaxID=29817 RepID=A0AAX6EAP1_IRIPA|nr:methyltransferase-like protein 7A [Iris pallida]
MREEAFDRSHLVGGSAADTSGDGRYQFPLRSIGCDGESSSAEARLVRGVLRGGHAAGMRSYETEVGEALPIEDNSVDAVIGTLVLCSVKDVGVALREVRRVLKPGGLYLFIEHVAAREGSLLRLMQSILDPLQQLLSDGCHLTRETGSLISEGTFL